MKISNLKHPTCNNPPSTLHDSRNAETALHRRIVRYQVDFHLGIVQLEGFVTLSGLTSVSLALANGSMYEPDALWLTSCLLDYCALSIDEIHRRPNSDTQL